MTWAFLIFVMLLSGIVVLAGRFGGRDERLGVAAILVAAVATPFLQAHSYAEPEGGILLIDASLFIALALIAMRSKSFWPIWAAGFQLCGLAAHFAASNLPTMLPAIYAQTLAIWTFPVLASLAGGIWFEARMRDGRR